MSVSTADRSEAMESSSALIRNPLLLLAVVANLVIAVVALVVEGLTPTTVLYPILVAAGGYRLLRSGSGAALLAGTAVVMLVVHVPFVAAALSGACVHPVDAARACHEVLWLIYLAAAPAAMAVLAALAWARQRRA